MRIDLHTHSTASDGTDTPAELMLAARAAGLDVVAITDHDTTGGWAEAELARPAGLTVIRGAEFSTRLVTNDRVVSVHLLGYLFDPASEPIVAEQARLKAERRRRGLSIVEKMVADGIPISAGQVLAIADGAPIGRPHIGRALVAAGVVKTVDEAFGRLLAGRSPYYVPKLDTDLLTAVRMISAAGGVSVIAHPRARGAARALTAGVIAELTGAGLGGLEVWHPDHDEVGRAELLRIAAECGLLTTGSSDYHGHNKTLELGQESTRIGTLRALVAAAGAATAPLGEVA